VSGSTLLIVNPASGGGRSRRALARIEARLDEAFGPLERVRTRAPGDAAELAREAAFSGVSRVVVAGGDGTLREVACGILAAGRGADVEVVPLPMGTGGDWLRGLGVPRPLGRAVEWLRVGKTRSVDAGRVTCRARDGRPLATWFVNVASCGLSGLVTEQVGRGRKRLGGGLAFLVGTLQALAAYRATPVSLSLDGECIFEGPLVLAAAANGNSFGGGMLVAPRARIDDGLLDVVVIGAVSKRTVLRHLPRIYRGTHLQAPGVSLHRGRRLRVEGGPVPVELDGDPLATLPMQVEVVPGALRMRGVQP